MAGSIKRAVTSYDVAKAAGVSQSAVSRAFTDGAKISPATREKVRKVAAELGYRPSFIAQSLITRRSTLIGIVVLDWSIRSTRPSSMSFRISLI